jgi:hypothetical protein
MSDKITEINGVKLKLNNPKCPQDSGYNIFDINASLSMRIADKNKKLDKDKQ